MGNDQKPIHPAWLSNPSISKFCYLTCMVIIPHNLKTMLTHSCKNFSPHDFKNVLTLYTELFWIGSATSKIFAFWGRKVETLPIIITVINNITLLVSHNFIFFGYFILMSHGTYWSALPTKFSSFLFDVVQ